MIDFNINGKAIHYTGDENISLLNYLRNECRITSVKDGCSGQAACGACMVEINGKARLSCNTPLKNLQGASVITTDGIPPDVLDVIAKSYVLKGAVQCGFCTPGLIMRTKILFQEKPEANREEIRKAIGLNLCRCTGYVKIVDAIELALKTLKNNEKIEFPRIKGYTHENLPKYKAYETAIGKRKFVNDIFLPDMLYGALHFSKYPRAIVKKIDTSDAQKVQGVIRIFTASDIPGERYQGIIYKDWPVMIAEGETTNYIGDVIAGVVAITADIARQAAKLIKVDYDVLEPVTDVFKATEENTPRVHKGKSNILESCRIKRGDVENTFHNSDFIVQGNFETQRIEHAFLEPESAVAHINNDKLELFSQGQGVYVDREQIASMLNLPTDKVHVILVPCGGGFGGREDMTVQGHASLFAWTLKKPVKLTLTREESIRMHPKRHPVFMDMTLACDEKGKFTALKLRARGDTGAYASVGTKVMERVAGHATGGYYVPVVDIEALTVTTNNIPSGAMRGFGANQVNFAIESCIDMICEKGGFDRWQIRYDNALVDGLATATGQILENVGIRDTLLAIKNEFYEAKYAGIACGIKNSGVGNGMKDESFVKIHIVSENKIVIHHGWTEMGQGIHNVAIQTLCQETGLKPDIVDVIVDTDAEIVTGMTTSSRATVLLGNAIIETAKELKKDIEKYGLAALTGKIYYGGWVCDWTTKPGDNVEKIITHYSYGYATQMVILNDNGEIEKVVAAHDAGHIMNPLMFEGQVEGAVLMGLGYALTEELPMKDGYIISDKLRDCGVLKAKDAPEIKVIGVEVKDRFGPYGAKGLGEIGLVPTAAAVANALYTYDKIRRYKLPMKKK